MKQMGAMAVALAAGLLAGSVEAGEEVAVELPGGAAMEFVWIEPGPFLMGSPFEAPEYRYASERPQHPVAITRGFYLGKYEVTQAQWTAVIGPQIPAIARVPIGRWSWSPGTRCRTSSAGSTRPWTTPSIDCPPKPNGNTRRGRARRRGGPLATTRACWTITRGISATTLRRGPRRWGSSGPIPGGCTIFTAMCGSGWRTGTVRTAAPAR